MRNVADLQEDSLSRSAVAGIVLLLLDYSAFEAQRFAQETTPDQRAAIIRAAKWPIRDQARESVQHHVDRIRAQRNLERLRQAV